MGSSCTVSASPAQEPGDGLPDGRDPVLGRRHRRPGEFEECREQVRDVDERAGDGPRDVRRQRRRKDRESRDADAALVDELLEVAVGAARGVRPFRAVVDERVEASHVLVGEVEPLREEGFVVGEPADVLARRPVVREEEDQRVVQLAELPQFRDEPPDVVVEAFDHRRIELHLAGFDAALVFAQIVPAPREVG